MVKEAPLRVEEIDRWGANFKKLRNNKLDQRFLVPTLIEELVIQVIIQANQF